MFMSRLPTKPGINGSVPMKIKAIEDFDAFVVGTVLNEVKSAVICGAGGLRSPHTHCPSHPYAGAGAIPYYGPGIRRGQHGKLFRTGCRIRLAGTIAGHELLPLFLGDFMTL